MHSVKITSRAESELKRLDRSGRVEEERGSSGDAGPFPLPAHRTGRADFPHPALRQGSPPDSRTGTGMHTTQTQNAQRTEDHIVRQNACAARRHLMPPSQEMTHSGRDMIIDRALRLPSSPVAEVVRPAAQNAVEPVSDFRPRALIAGYQHLVQLASQPRHPLL